MLKSTHTYRTQSVLKGAHRYRTHSVLKSTNIYRTQSVLKGTHRYNLAQSMEMFFIDKIESEVVTLRTMNSVAILIHNLRTIYG